MHRSTTISALCGLPFVFSLEDEQNVDRLICNNKVLAFGISGQMSTHFQMHLVSGTLVRVREGWF